MNLTHQLTSILAAPGWGPWDGHPAGGLWWIFPLAWLAFWAVIVGLVAWYLLAGRRRSDLDGARRILGERYARGELTADEYRDRLRSL